jgi:hypothetical protein
MKIQAPKTIEDFENIEKSILELMDNPYTDLQMYISLKCRLRKCREKMEELKKSK